MKEVVVLGSTGSIGVNTLKVIESHPDKFKVTGLSSNSNIRLLKKQIEKFKPKSVAVVNPEKAQRLKKEIGQKRLQMLSGVEGLNIISSVSSADIVVVAISGASAIYPLLAAIDSGKHICLANKESIVIAGDIILKKARKNNVTIVPVDSEHNAIFQCLAGENASKVNKIYLTGSGGSLHKVPKSRFSSLKVKDVLRHPKWNMGKKITIDSATMMNKGLEIIEAKHLFDISVDKIKVLIHPEAVVHSMVEFVDGSVIAQLGVTDMRLPIQYAMTFPERARAILPPLDFTRVGPLNFSYPDLDKYPCLCLAIVAAKLGGTYPAVLNAADEAVVKAFLDKRIKFTKIPSLIEKTLSAHRSIEKPTLDDIMHADRWAREEISSLC